MEQGIRLFLEGLFAEETGLERAACEEILAFTPGRVTSAMMSDLLGGYHEDPAAGLEPVPAPGASGPVLLHGIRFASMCAHHLLPFRGTAHVGFVPEASHVGLGGIARLVDALARRLTIQEALTAAIADHLDAALKPRSVLVVLDAEHLCLSVRGARKTGHSFRTIERRGERCPDLEALLSPGMPG
jgi:GTP cyclohydrolase I